jgi:hypothetical protein
MRWAVVVIRGPVRARGLAGPADDKAGEWLAALMAWAWVLLARDRERELVTMTTQTGGRRLRLFATLDPLRWRLGHDRERVDLCVITQSGGVGILAFWHSTAAHVASHRRRHRVGTRTPPLSSSASVSFTNL